MDLVLQIHRDTCCYPHSSVLIPLYRTQCSLPPNINECLINMGFNLKSFPRGGLSELLDHLYPSHRPKKTLKPKTEKELNEFIILETRLKDPGAEAPSLVDRTCAEYPDFEKSHSSCHYAAGRYYQEANGHVGEFSGYIPNSKRISDASARQNPMYWFRVTHDDSGGGNEEGCYRSQAIKCGMGKADFFKFSNNEVKETVHNHETNKNCQSHWISFTDSAITAIAYALQLFEQGRKNVRIHMIDTTKIQNLPIIVHAYPMLKGYRVCSNRKSWYQKMIMGASYTEFLVWDELIAEADSIKLSTLLAAGLTDLPIKLKSSVTAIGASGPKRTFLRPCQARQQHLKREDLKTVELIREAYYSGPRSEWRGKERWAARCGYANTAIPVALQQKGDTRAPMSTDTMNRYRRVAECCVKPRFQLVMLIALLSMSTPEFYEDSMVDELMRISPGKFVGHETCCLLTMRSEPACQRCAFLHNGSTDVSET